MKDFDTREKGGYKKHILKDASDLDLGQDPRLKLMPFQVCLDINMSRTIVIELYRSTVLIGSATIGGIFSTVSLQMTWVLYV